MNRTSNVISLWIAIAMIFVSLTACNTRPIPGDLILSTYNSDMDATKEFAPMDTLYVTISGMNPNKYYQISAIDASGNTIAKIEAQTDDDGVIDVVPLWYDIGLKSGGPGNPPYLDTYGDLTPLGFKVNVKSLYDNGESTNFTQDMFIVYGKADTDTNPKPVIYSCYKFDNGVDPVVYYPENAFKETGTVGADGLADPKTTVYVKADRVPTKIGNDVTVTNVDFYVMRFTGAAYRDGDDLYNSDNNILGTPVTAAVAVDGTVAGTPLWDLNGAIKVINPDGDTMAYSIVMDVDRDGVYDEGIDTDTDGVADYFIDGVDGNGVPGFIIQNTPANDPFVYITDENGDAVYSIPESGALASQYLNISIDNVPMPPNSTLRVYLMSNFSGTDNGALAENARAAYTELTVDDAPTPSATELRYLPIVPTDDFLDTNAVVGTYTYTAGAITEDAPYDLIVDMGNDGQYDAEIDIFLENAVTVLNVNPTPVFVTCTDVTGATVTSLFDETNSEGNTRVYLDATNAPALYDVYVMARDEALGMTDQDPLLRTSMFSVAGLAGGADPGDANLIWDLDGTHPVINPGIGDNTYTLVVDEDRDGLFDNGVDDVLTIEILNTNANSYPRLTYVNIASGGSFGNTYAQHWTLYTEYCDYRDLFNKNGLDTNPNNGYGVKAVFNPYFSWFYNPDPQEPVAGLYNGLYVDVYIVNAATFDLADYGHAGELNDTVDVTGRHSTLVVQPSCYNGVGMMTVWPARMTPGSYYVIVDVNRNGRIDEGTDIIDAVNQNGTSIVDDATVVGFSVQ